MLTQQSVSALERWLATVSKRQIRLLESFQDVLLPDGRRLRGVQLAPDLYMDRNKVLHVRQGVDLAVAPVPLDEVVRQYHLGQVAQGWQRALLIARQRRSGCPR